MFLWNYNYFLEIDTLIDVGATLFIPPLKEWEHHHKLENTTKRMERQL